MSIAKVATGVLALCLVSASPALAKPKHWHDDQKHGNKARHDGDDDSDDRRGGVCYLSSHDVRIVHDYYEPRHRSLPPGLAKKYRRTGHLPPGWEKRMEPLPRKLEDRLAVLPEGYRRGYLDGEIVVYSPRTRVIIDVAALF
jgi:hypothetical protein